MSYATALAFATARHAGQVRKGTTRPYVGHPIAVAGFCREARPDDTDLAIAALCHDLREDTETTDAELRARFGERVAFLVDAVTSPKAKTRAKLAVVPEDVAILKCADLLSNTSETLANLQVDGPSVWDRFAGGRARKLDYYQKLSGALAARFPNEPLVIRLVAVVDQLGAW